MSSSLDSEQDLELKLRAMRYFWSLGYFTRRNVPLLEPQASGKQYTDIDVLAVKLDEELNSQFLVCDCKSGTQTKTRERFFWLSGVMKFFGAPQGVFIRTRIFESKYAELAKRLGIIPLSASQLGELEKVYSVDSSFFGAFSKESVKSEKLFSILHPFALEISDYLRTFYWADLPPQQITTLIVCSKRINGLEEIDEKAKNFLVSYLLSLLSLSVVRFAKNLIVIPDSEKSEYVRLELLGGAMEHNARTELLGGFYNFMTSEIQTRYKVKYPITKSQFLESLTPGYSKYLVDLLMRLSLNPRHYVSLPKLMDLLAHEGVLASRSLHIQDMVESSIYVDPKVLIKPMIDFITFAERSEIITMSQSIAFKEIVSSI